MVDDRLSNLLSLTENYPYYKITICPLESRSMRKIWHPLIIFVILCTESVLAYAQDLTSIHKLVELGYDSSVSARILEYRPDVAFLVTHPLTAVSFTFPSKTGNDDFDMIPTVDQSREPLLLYRGINIGPESYDSRYFKFNAGSSDGKMYTTTDGDDAVVFAAQARSTQDIGKDSIILELQVPRFFALNLIPNPTIDNGNYRITLRSVMPDDAVFLRRVGITKQVSGHTAVWPDEIKKVQWYSFDQIKSALLKVHLQRETPLKF